jgi:hypothetical protein
LPIDPGNQVVVKIQLDHLGLLVIDLRAYRALRLLLHPSFEPRGQTYLASPLLRLREPRQVHLLRQTSTSSHLAVRPFVVVRQTDPQSQRQPVVVVVPRMVLVPVQAQSRLVQMVSKVWKLVY